MPIPVDFDRISVHWTLFSGHCTVSFHKGAKVADTLEIRPNVSEGDPAPSGWNTSLRLLKHGGDVDQPTLRAVLPPAAEVVWDPILHEGSGVAEVLGKSELYKVRLKTRSPQSVLGKKLPEPEKSAISARLDAVRTFVWG